MANATDLLAGGKDDVKATFGADSFVMMCIIIAELIVGVAMYIRTKNLLILLGPGCGYRLHYRRSYLHQLIWRETI